MKRIFGIHGWEGSPNYGWWPWFKKSLEEKGFEVSVPQMPNAAHPKMDEWLAHLKAIVGKPDKNCFFVGHSLGCITILRFIEKLQERERERGRNNFSRWLL